MAYVPNSGSVVAFQSDPTKLVGTVSVIGTLGITGNPSISGTVNIGTQSGSIVAFQGTVPWNIAGSVAAFQAGTQITSVSGQVTVVSSLAGGIFPVSGSVAAVITNTPTVTPNFSSIIAINAGSVVALSQGSVITVLQAPSIVGTYAEDATHTSADKGIFTLGVRNDAVASFTSANLEYNPVAVDSAGRTLTKPFGAEESRVEGYNSVVSTSVTTLVAAAGAGLKNYITDIVIANTGATTTLITFRSGGGTSVLGYGIAPTGGGSNMLGFATPMRTLANETFDFQATSASSILYVKVSGYKAP